MRNTLCGIAPLLALLLAASAGIGQVATGVYQYGTFDKPGIDTINVGNLNVHLSVPVLNKTGRGLPFNANLIYDSSIYYPSGVGGYGTWTPVQNFTGWSSDTGLIFGKISYSANGFDDQYEVSYYVGPPEGYINVPVNCYWTNYYNWTFTDTSGVSHVLGGETTQFNYQDWSPNGFTCPTYTANPYSSGSTTDGSGLTLSVTNYTQATVTAPNGTATENTNGSATTETDSNGNQISADGLGNFTDTTGNVVLRVTGNTTTAQIYTYYDTSGNPQKVTVNYSPYTIRTNFGCSGIGEYGPTTKYLVSSIVFADSSEYQFTYEPTPGYPSNVTGRLQSILVPQGNTINYTYNGGNGGIECADGSAAGLTRTTNSDSGSAATSLTYSRTITGSGTSKTTVVDGLQNNKVYTFVEASNESSSAAQYYETTRNVYQGNQSGTPVIALSTCYNGTALPCTSRFALPIGQIDTYQLLNGLQMDGTETMINSSGMTTSSTIYDFGGSSSRGSTLSKEQWTYGYSIPSLVTQDERFDGTGTEAGNTTYSYDGGTLQTKYVVPQHVAVSAPRGNLTSVTQYANQSTSYTTTATYEDTGSIISAMGPNGTTAFGYDSATFVYLLGVGLPTPSSSVSIVVGESYDTTYTGVPLSTTDPNSQSTTFPSNKYDSMLRPTEQDNPDGGKITWTYTPTMVTTDTYQTSSTYGQTINELDGYGRPSRTFVANGQSSNSWYQQDTCYDANGNVSFVSYRYQGSGTGSSKVCSGAGTTYYHDVLGRVTAVTQSNGETRTTIYSGRATETIDENNVKRISQVDGLNRTTVVCEISTNNSMPGSGTATSCPTDLPGTGFTTNYSYALATETTTVTQGTQTRTFQNDWLGRPVSTTEPESGTTTYSYAYNPNPGSSGLGLWVKRQKPKANQSNSSVLTATYTQYDTLGRPVNVNYDDGLTPTKNYAYDASAGWGVTQQNTKGRLSFAGISYTAGTVYGYDLMGRTNLVAECTPSNCGSGAYVLNYTYDLAGNMLTSTDGFGVTDTYTYSPANEMQSITSSLNDSSHPPNLVSGVQNGPFGPLNWHLGNRLSGVQSFDTLGRLSGGWVCSGSTSPYCTGGTQIYGFTADWKGGQLQSSADTALNQESNYGYDEFNRLKSRIVTSGSPVTNLSWTYDRWGNRWSQTVTAGSGPQPSYSFNTANNQISSNGFTYDAAGNQTWDGTHHYTYDAEGNVLQVDSGSTASYVYNALNQRVRMNTSGEAQEIIFNAAGQRVSIWDPVHNWEVSGQTYWGSKPVEFYADGYAQFQHQDWLGTMRVTTTNTGAVQGTYASLPFGDAYSANGTDNDANHFAMLDFDSGSDTDHAQYRQYSPTEGRWLRPDPYAGSYHLSNPQSMNRYVYASNNPLSNIDPSGQDDWSPDEEGGYWGDDGGGGYYGGGGGGYYGGGGAGDSSGSNIQCGGIADDSGAWGGHSSWCIVTVPSDPGTTTCYGDGCQFGGESASFNAQGQAAQNAVFSQIDGSGSSGGGNGSSSAPNNGTQTQQPQHFWQKPGCGSAMGETAVGALSTAGGAALIWFAGPEFLAVAGESVALEAAEGGTLAGGLAIAHIGEAVGTAAAAPILLTAHGINGIASNCF